MAKYTVEMIDENLLLQPLKAQKKTEEFISPSDSPSSLFVIKHSSLGSEYDAGDIVLLKPGNYSHVVVEDEEYLVASEHDIAAQLSSKEVE